MAAVILLCGAMTFWPSCERIETIYSVLVSSTSPYSDLWPATKQGRRVTSISS